MWETVTVHLNADFRAVARRLSESSEVEQVRDVQEEVQEQANAEAAPGGQAYREWEF